MPVELERTSSGFVVRRKQVRLLSPAPIDTPLPKPRRSSLEWMPRCQRGEHGFESRPGRRHNATTPTLDNLQPCPRTTMSISRQPTRSATASAHPRFVWPVSDFVRSGRPQPRASVAQSEELGVEAPRATVRIRPEAHKPGPVRPPCVRASRRNPGREAQFGCARVLRSWVRIPPRSPVPFPLFVRIRGAPGRSAWPECPSPFPETNPSCLHLRTPRPPASCGAPVRASLRTGRVQVAPRGSKSRGPGSIPGRLALRTSGRVVRRLAAAQKIVGSNPISSSKAWLAGRTIPPRLPRPHARAGAPPTTNECRGHGRRIRTPG